MTVLIEPECIVLDIGAVYCKVGFAGDPNPRHFFSYNTDYLLCGAHQYDFSIYEQQNFQPFLDYNMDGDVDKMHWLLRQLLSEIFFRKLCINPKKKQVIFVENPFTTSTFKKILTAELFDTFEVGSISFLLSHIAGLFTFGRLTGLVVEIGYKETTIIPIFDGRPCLFYVEIVSIGGALLDELVWRFMLGNECYVLNQNGTAALFRELDEEFADNRFIVEKIKFSCCTFDSKATGSQMIFCDSLKGTVGKDDAVQIAYKNGLFVVFSLSSFNEQVTQALLGEDDSGRSIGMAICDVIIKAPRDLRFALSNSIAMIGGCVSICGFRNVFFKQLRRIIGSHSKYTSIWNLTPSLNILNNLVNPEFSGWTGGSLMGPHRLTSELKNTEYKAGYKIPDWSCHTVEFEV